MIGAGLLEGLDLFCIEKAAIAQQHGAHYRCAIVRGGEHCVALPQQEPAQARQLVTQGRSRPWDFLDEFGAANG